MSSIERYMLRRKKRIFEFNESKGTGELCLDICLHGCLERMIEDITNNEDELFHAWLDQTDLETLEDAIRILLEDISDANFTDRKYKRHSSYLKVYQGLQRELESRNVNEVVV